MIVTTRRNLPTQDRTPKKVSAAGSFPQTARPNRLPALSCEKWTASENFLTAINITPTKEQNHANHGTERDGTGRVTRRAGSRIGQETRFGEGLGRHRERRGK